MPAHTGRLLLTPQDPFLVPDPRSLRLGLAAAGLLGAPLSGIAGGYAVGDRFFTLVVFAGCSVQVALEPSSRADTPFCHVRLAGPYPEPLCLTGRNTRPPRCRACRSPLRDWNARLDAGAAGVIRCPACGEKAPAWCWDWKGQAGCGRLFLAVEEVFPGEATPAPALMERLEEMSGNAWRHFYIQDFAEGTV